MKIESEVMLLQKVTRLSTELNKADDAIGSSTLHR